MRLTNFLRQWSGAIRGAIQRLVFGMEIEQEEGRTPEKSSDLSEPAHAPEEEGTSTRPAYSAASAIDTELAAWHNRPLGSYLYLYLDARLETVQREEEEEKLVVPIAVGVTTEGRRQVLGFSVSPWAPEAHWTQFLQSLLARGLRDVRLIISADHEGLRGALHAILPGVPWQRCQSQLQREAQEQVHTEERKRSVAVDVSTIFEATDRVQAEMQLERVAAQYAAVSPELAHWMRTHLPEGLTFLDFPERHRRLIRTTRVFDPIHQELRRRTRSLRTFSDTASCVRLVSSALRAIDLQWQTREVHADFTEE